MSYFLGVLLFVAAGYSLAIILGISKDHLLYDISLGWFLGAGYYTLAWFFIVYLCGFPVSAWLSFIIILIPAILVFILKRNLRQLIVQSAKNVKSQEYLPGQSFFSLNSVIILYSVFVFVLIAIHSISTPSNAEDALHLRALTPFYAYDNNFSASASGQIFSNGIWPTFVTLLFWHIKGGAEHFYINYTIITSLFFFLSLVYLAPTIRGNAQQGIYGVFLVLTLPLFIYHATATYADIRMVLPYCLGFLFFTFYVRERNTRDLKTLIIFFTITCLIKAKGEIAGITGLSVAMLFIATNFISNRKLPGAGSFYFLLPLILYFAVKNYYVQNISELAGFVKSASDQMLSATFLSEELQSSDEYKIRGFIGSLFVSGNFGIIFYVFLANVLMNIRKILSRPMVWDTLFLLLVYMETTYYMVIKYTNLPMHSAIVNRTVIVISAMSALFLASLWSRTTKVPLGHHAER